MDLVNLVLNVTVVESARSAHLKGRNRSRPNLSTQNYTQVLSTQMLFAIEYSYRTQNQTKFRSNWAAQYSKLKFNTQLVHSILKWYSILNWYSNDTQYSIDTQNCKNDVSSLSHDVCRYGVHVFLLKFRFQKFFCLTSVKIVLAWVYSEWEIRNRCVVEVNWLILNEEIKFPFNKIFANIYANTQMILNTQNQTKNLGIWVLKWCSKLLKAIEYSIHTQNQTNLLHSN